MGARPLIKPRCVNCREKKIKCDYKQPECGPCSRSRFKCKGYVTELVIIPYEERCTSTAAADEAGQHGALASVRKVARPPSVSELRNSPYVKPSINRISLGNQFLDLYYPTSRLWWQDACTWVTEAFDGRHQFTALQSAAAAMGTTVIASVHQNRQYRKDGLKLYGKALAELRKASQAAQLYHWFDLLLTSMILLSYEVGFPKSSTLGFAARLEKPTDSRQVLAPTTADRSGVKGHMIGISSFLRIMGPRAFQQPGLYHTGFLYCRLTLIMNSLLEEVPTFLSTPMWRDLPWARVKKNNLHKCLDMVSRIPNLLSLANSMARVSSDTQDLLRPLWTQFMREYEDINARFDAWRAGLVESREALFIVCAASNFEATYAHFEELHTFDHIGHAEVALFYWMGRLLMHDALWRVSQTAVKDVAHHATSRAKMAVLSAENFADGILKSVPFCLQKENGILGMKFTVLPLKVAIRFYRRWGMTSRVLVCVKYLELIASRECGSMIQVL
ncbi:hypothetical protein QQS21_005456 [Conoideocrella luteorostrata]|uniref:Zn(2)-C6 fungal-type domain-containing protein n=1 Tax=Conoideocrella luteorostrata TaxID=1105319 RepID=A0AAJ0CPG6_9HYPO|nr:hypothetical protein QQS21_005456 [Conoideocrella luteorostrata]